MCLLYRAIYPVHAVQIKMAVMLQIPRVFPRVSCLGSAKAVQCLRAGPKIGDKRQQIARYSPVCPWGQPPADKCITRRSAPTRNILIKGPFKFLNDRFPYPFIYLNL